MSGLIGELGPARLRRLLAEEGLLLDTGAVATRVFSNLPETAEAIAAVYKDFPIVPDGQIPDFRIGVVHTGGLRRWVRRQVTADVGLPAPIVPLPARMASVMLEMALNWCVATRAHWFIVLHAAVVEKRGRVLVIPGESGHGKSTLCASLVAAGWRLFSDEFALFDVNEDRIYPNVRPISLKNESIDVIRHIAGAGAVTPAVTGTPKGAIAYMPPPAEAIAARHEGARPLAVLFPQFDRQAKPRLQPLPKARAFMGLTSSSVNYELHGERAFRRMADFIDRYPVYQIAYADLDEARALIAEIETEVTA